MIYFYNKLVFCIKKCLEVNVFFSTVLLSTLIVKYFSVTISLDYILLLRFLLFYLEFQC